MVRAPSRAFCLETDLFEFRELGVPGVRFLTCANALGLICSFSARASFLTRGEGVGSWGKGLVGPSPACRKFIRDSGEFGGSVMISRAM